ncbi:MAG TPA: arginine--tRNA ligase [Candidatus Paceibacterota bacterium]|nr:arginine--tRNA ligase [Candidatus Paceibacterota bacterium]
MIREALEKAIAAALGELGAGSVSFTVERPGSMDHGDYATNAALAAAKALKKNPKEVAQMLLTMLSSIEGIKKTEIAGAGFINFFISREAVAKEISRAAQDAEWGSNSLYKGKTVMVEYTDPNPFKEFHIGHLMSNAIGESVARVLEISGAKVIRANYQGDVGPHVAKAIWGKMQKPELSWGETYVLGNAEYEAHKADIDMINKQVYEKSDDKVAELYAAGRKLSLEHFEELYTALGTKFDRYFFESETTPLGTALVKKHPELFVESEGARVFRGEEEGLHTRVFITSQGLPTYEAKDLGLLDVKSKEKLDVSITVTANEQNEYFKVVLAAAAHIAELAEIAGKTKHVSHGMMRFAEGKMSSRKGNVITGESLLEDLKDAAKEKMEGRELADAEKTAEAVAVGAIKYSVLKQGSGRDIIFDPEKSLSLEGDSGPYIQYAHTRALSLLKNAGREGVEPGTDDKPAAANALERLILHFPDVLSRAAQELEPHHITTYVTELASTFNSWYASERIIGGTNPQYGILIAQAVEATLKKGLHALGIPAPEEM